MSPDRTSLTAIESGYPDQKIVASSRAGMEQCLHKMATTFTQSGRRSAVGRSMSR